MIENAESGGDSHHPENREENIQEVAQGTGYQFRKKIGANTGDQQDDRCDRHAHKQLHLMMQQAAIVEETHKRDEHRPGKYSQNLLIRTAMARKQHR